MEDFMLKWPRERYSKIKKVNLSEQISNAEIYEIAGALLKQFGKDAAIYASLQAGDKLSTGDITGYRIWKRLIMLVDGILEEAPPDRNCLH